MTFQQAQSQLQDAIARVTPDCPTDDIERIKADLSALLRALPNTEEFDPIARTIKEIQPQLSDRVTVQIVDRIVARGAVLQGAVALLDEVTRRAKTNASQLSLENAKLLISAISASVEQIKSIQSDLQEGRPGDALPKTEALIALLGQVKAKIADAS